MGNSTHVQSTTGTQARTMGGWLKQLFSGRRGNAKRCAAKRRTVRPAFLGLEDRLVPAGNLVVDINTEQLGSNPRDFVDVNGVVFFAATDAAHGEELWKTDGTEAGTVLVKDILPGVGSSSPSNMTNVNGTLFFSDQGRLWKSNGTAAGTVRVTYDNFGWNPSNLDGLTDVNGTLFFSATTAPNDYYGHELWESDGTSNGTLMVRNINSNNSSYPSDLINVNGTLFFTADDGVNGRELWSSDGTAAGTVMVRDICSYGSMGSNPTGLTKVNSTLYFTADDLFHGMELWQSNGTVAGTVLVKDILPGQNSTNPMNLTDVNGTLFFTAEGQLWKSDGTDAGTISVRTISAANLTNVNGTLFFTGSDGTSFGLWKSDGTGAGTVFVKAIAASDLIAANGTLLFMADDAVHGQEVWTSDGTDAGTVMLKDILAGASSSTPAHLSSLNGIAYFSANDGGTHGQEVWKSDGTDMGTVLVKDVNTSPDSSFPSNAVNVNGTLFFSATDGGARGQELWKTDGTPAGTVLVRDILPGSVSSFPLNLTNVDGTLYFTAYTSAGTGLWKSDGTNDGTVLIKDALESPSNLTDVNGTLYLTLGNGLWKSDGTEGGTVLVKDNSGHTMANLTNVNGRLFFTRSKINAPIDLWKSDGTDAGTVLVKAAIAYFYNWLPPLNLVAVNGNLFFPANSALWKTDGTEAGTVLVKDLPNNSLDPLSLTEVNGTLFFLGGPDVYGTNRSELWKSDGTTAGTVLVSHFVPGATGPAPGSLTAVNGALMFTADDGVHGRELWQSDGTDAGTVLVHDIGPDSAASAPESLTVVNGTLYFTADDGVHGRQVWRSNGTAIGTVLDTEVDSESADAPPGNLAAVGNTLFFAAADQAYGRELWSSVAPPTVTIEQAPGQTDPVTSATASFDVKFSLDVNGFDASDVDLSASTVGGTLTAAVIQHSPSHYTVNVSGMFGVGTVVASILPSAAQDALGIPSAGSFSVDNVVAFNGIGTVGLTSASYTGAEGTSIIVTASRTGGSQGAVSVTYDLNDGTAIAPSDYSHLTGTFDWAAGESGDKSISIPITADGKSEKDETFTVALGTPTGSAGMPLIGTLAAPITIVKSDPLGSGSKFLDADGDAVTVTLIQPKYAGGTVAYYLNNGVGPIQSIELSDTDPANSVLNVTVKKAKAPVQSDGLVAVGAVTGTGVKTLNLAKSTLDGPGINLTGMVQSVKLAAVLKGADIIIAGSIPRKTTAFAITGSVGDLTLVKLDAPLSSFKAAGVGAGTFEVPSIGAMMIKGNFNSDVTISGAGIDPGKPALKSLAVTGAIDGLDIFVNGSVGSVSALAFHDSRLFAGYSGADDGSGAFNFPATVSTFKVTGKADAFQNSSVIAATFKNVSLRSVDSTNDGDKFGFYAKSIRSLRVIGSSAFKYDPTSHATQGVGDFEVKLV